MEQIEYCVHCGAPAQRGQFCANCGKPLTPTTDHPAPPPISTWHQPVSPPTQPIPSPPSQLPSSPRGGFHLGHPSLKAFGHRPGRVGVTVAVGVVAIIVAGSVLAQHTATKTVTGALSLEDGDTTSGLDLNDTCSGDGGYDDITYNAQAVLEDGDGSTLATSNLTSGSYDGLACVFHFTFDDVPKAGFYVFKVGHTTRGDLRYSYQAMVDQDWALALSLGD